MTGRLLSRDGASFALLPVPDLRASGGVGASGVLVDVELLSPDRFVRYLGRAVSAPFLRDLADAYISIAGERLPEQCVPTVQDDRGGVSVSVVGSTPFTVTVEVLVVPDPAAPVVEPDGLRFDVDRAGFVSAAHELREFLVRNSQGVLPS